MSNADDKHVPGYISLDVDQSSIKSKIRKYLQLNNRDADFVKKFEDGYCSGISTLWAFTKWLQTQPETGKMRDDYNWFKATVESIVKWDETKESLGAPQGPSLLAQNFEQFIAKIEYFQNTDYYVSIAPGDLSKKILERPRVNKSDTVNLNESVLSYSITNKDTDLKEVKNIEQEYSIAALFTLRQLKQLLNTPEIIQEHKLIKISSHNHAVALFKDGSKYWYFDPNNPKGEIETSSSDEIAELIFASNGFNDLLPSPLGLRMFYFDNKSTYPDVKTVLSTIKPEIRSTKGYADECSGLCMAAQINSLDSLQYYLTMNDQADLNTKDTYGWTGLMLAARNGDLEATQALIAAGANLNEKSNDDWTALMLAANSGHIEVVKALIAAGIRLNEKDNDGLTALMLAAMNGHLEVVQTLIAAKANFNEKDNNGLTALMLAALNGHLEVVQTLKQAGANINAKAVDNYNMTALMCTVENNNSEMVKKLIESGASISETEINGYTALMIATEKGSTESAKELITAHIAQHIGFEKKDTNGCTALMIAVINDNIAIARDLLEAGASLDAKDNAGKTALMWATERHNQEMIELLTAKTEQLNNRKFNLGPV